MRTIEVLVLVVLWCGLVEGLTRQNAMGEWRVHIDKCPKQQLNGLDLPTSMPTSIHLDLLRNGKIADSFKGGIWESQKWISECNLTYTKKLTFSKQILAYQNIEIVFEGIDTYSTVYFNGQKILETQNAFVEYRALIQKNYIKENAENQIQIEMYSTNSFDQAANSVNKMPFIYAHTRKACYQYSWDWAPFVNTIGVWKDIYFVGYDSVKIDYVWARNREVNSDFAIINFATALKISAPSALKDVYLEISEEHSQKGSQKIPLDGKEHVYGDLKILNPRFWWPNGIGQPNIYEFTVSLTKNGEVIDSKNIIYGIRTVELDLADTKFTVIVNGYPVYCKGANYVPPDMLYSRITNPDYQSGNSIENLLRDAVDSNYNMIRLWGGGQYESNQLLELASRLGIMIFYDFMFSDSIYPSTDPFLRNVEVQIRQQVQRARNYPCLMLWSGNNEIYQGIKAWGWSSAKYRQDFKKLFEQAIPKILEKQDPHTPYISSSPIYGVGNAGFNKGGDIHYWGVWAAGSNFQSYKTALGPFNSEFGTQSLPVWETIKYFAENEKDRYYSSQVMLAHERHNSKFNTLQKYIKTYAHPSKDMEHEAYLSGLIQAFGVQIAIISQRIAKPKSWGTLYWQFNDAWPGISWSSIDYFGRWKPLQYMAKRSYPNVAIFFQDGKITAINDNLYSVQAVTIVKVFNLNGALLFNRTETIELKQNEVKNMPDVKNFNGKDVIVYTEIIAGRNKEMWSTGTFYPFKDLSLDPSAKLFVNYNTEFDIITLRTDKVIKNLYISHPDEYLKFSDNYFDLVPGRNYKVSLMPSHYGKEKRKLAQLKEKMLYRSYIQIHTDSKLEVIEE